VGFVGINGYSKIDGDGYIHRATVKSG